MNRVYKENLYLKPDFEITNIEGYKIDEIINAWSFE
jgi:hypothetical protein